MICRIARVPRLAGLVAARVGDYVQDFNRSDWIATGDDQLARFRVTAPCVLNDDAETGTGRKVAGNGLLMSLK